MVDPVVGRVRVERSDAGREGVVDQQQRGDERDGRGYRPDAHAHAELEQDDQDDRDAEPDERCGPGGGQQREAQDAGHRPDDVDGVCTQRPHALEQRTQGQRERREQRGDEHHDQRQDVEVGVGGAALGQAEVEVVLAAQLDVQLLLVDQPDDREEEQRERQHGHAPALATQAGCPRRCPGSWP